MSAKPIGQATVLQFDPQNHVQISELVNETNFSEDEVKALHRRYEQLVATQAASGTGIQLEQFERAFGLGRFEASRLFNLFSRSQPETCSLSFPDLCKGFSAFSPNASREEKVLASFQFFDTNGDGKIDRAELREVFEQFLKDNGMYLEPALVAAIVDHTFRDTFQAEGEKDEIGFEDYWKMVEYHPQLIAAMTISTWQLPL